MFDIWGIVLLMLMINMIFLPFVDKELKFLSTNGIKEVMLTSRDRGKCLFFFVGGKSLEITKHIYVCTIAFYIINTLGACVFLVQLFAQINEIAIYSYWIFILNLLLFFVIVWKMQLSKEELMAKKEALKSSKQVMK